MRLNLRQKLAVIVGTVSVSFLALMAVSWYLNVEMDRQTSVIHGRYIPLVELEYRLETQFEGINLAMRDAVSAQDIGALDSTVVLRDKFLAELQSASQIIEPAQIQELTRAVNEYFSTGHETSRRLIQNETGLSIVEAMTQMQAKRAVAESLLKKVTTFDRGKMTDAFVAIAQTQERSAGIRFWVSVVCIIATLSVSILIGRDIMNSVRKMSEGLSRFGSGDFQQPIPILGDDELSELSRRINMMAGQIQSLLREIESFSYTIAHDLRAPLRSVLGFSDVLREEHADQFSAASQDALNRIVAAAGRMAHMIDGLLSLSRLNRTALNKEQVDLSEIARKIAEELKGNDPARKISVEIQGAMVAWGDPKLLDILIANLLGNAWKFTKRNPEARIHFGHQSGATFFIGDNGAGFDMQYADKLFGTFQRLHSENEFEGHGIGLATVKSIIDRHHGRIWAESQPGKGATFYFTLT